MELLLILGLGILATILTPRIPIIKHLGPSALAFFFGVLAAFGLENTKAISQEYSNLFVLTSTFVFLSTGQIRQWGKLSKEAILAFIYVVISIILGALCLGLVLKSFWNSGHLISIPFISSVLVGGILNLGSLAGLLNLPSSLTVNIHLSNIMVNGVYFCLVLVLCRSPHFDVFPRKQLLEDIPHEGKYKNKLNLLLYVLFSWVVVYLLGRPNLNLNPFLTVGLVSIVGILFSLYGKFNRLQGATSYGEYLLTCYFVILGLGIKSGQNSGSGRMQIDSSILLITMAITMVALVFFFLIARHKKLDRDTVFMATIASFLGPAYVLPVAHRLENPQIIKTGIILGVIGLLLGNFVGLFLYKLLL